ncbi:transposase [Kocuria sp. WN036]|uniref:transposase n=1 Tax=Kocuria sp. WN036 TaxID=2032628 RepID=UPI001594F2D3|nr:transposase [Kocuria sp. WN036]
MWDAIVPVIETQVAAKERLTGVDSIGVDEHEWRHVGARGNGIMAHTRNEEGRPRARLLDLASGRTGAAYGDWLVKHGTAFTVGIRTATLDPCHGYTNAIRDELREAITVLRSFHGIELDWLLSTRSSAGCSRTPWGISAGPATRSTAFGAPY